MMSVDVQRFLDLMQFISVIWYGPIQIIISLWLLWNQLGPASLAGLACLLLNFPLTGYFSGKARMLQVKIMKAKDARSKLMNEILNGIKILKLYAWEGAFIDRITKQRGLEIKSLFRQSIFHTGIIGLFQIVPFLVSIISFITYIYTGGDHALDANKIFVSLSLFNIIRLPLALVPLSIANLMTVSLLGYLSNLF